MKEFGIKWLAGSKHSEYNLTVEFQGQGALICFDHDPWVSPVPSAYGVDQVPDTRSCFQVRPPYPLNPRLRLINHSQPSVLPGVAADIKVFLLEHRKIGSTRRCLLRWAVRQLKSSTSFKDC